MFKRIIIGVNANPHSYDAIALARLLAPPGSELLLAHVYHGYDRLRAHVGVSELAPQRQAETLLRELSTKSGIAQSRAVGAISVVRGLTDLVGHEQSDLMVLGSSSAAAGEHAAIRDEFHPLLKEPACAIAIAPSGYARSPPARPRIGLGYDGSEASRTALAAARSIAARHQGPLSICHAVPRISSAADDGDRALADSGQLGSAIGELTDLGDVEIQARYGEPSSVLIEFSAAVNLLVIGSRTPALPRRNTYAATTLRLVHGSHCALLIVPACSRDRTQVPLASTVITVPPRQLAE